MQTINISGQAHPVHFGMRQALGFARVIDAETGKVNFDDFLHVLFTALRRGASKSNKDFTFTLETLEDELDEDPEIFTQLTEAFSASKIVKTMNTGAEPGKRN